jgi:hypothetical protein
MAEENNEGTDINPKHAEAAYQEVSAEATALPASAIEVPRIRVGEVTLAALKVARFVKQPEVRARFVALPGFNSKDVDALPSYALALWHANTRRQVTSAATGGAKVSGELLERAAERRTRMIELLEFFVGDRPQVIAEVNAIKSGTGYMDIASDLGELSRLHRENDARLSGDSSGRYRPDVAVGALNDAAAIIRELSQASDPKEAAAWADALARCWTLLLGAYDRITRGASWLYGDRPDFDDLFPSMFAAGRRAGRKPANAPQEPMQTTPTVAAS